MFKTYYSLTKPGIIYGNALTAIAGFLFACMWHIDVLLLLGLLVGTSLVIASACVYNNYIDREIDKKMARTKKRALVNGTISVRGALVFATILGVIGFALLITTTNWLTVLVGVIAFVDYVVFYGVAKRKSVLGTIVGSISGAAPIVAGYTAVTNQFDTGAFLLFLIMVLWQMPHFYAIAMYRLKDYSAADIPVLPRVSGMRRTKIQILAYIVAFGVATALLSLYGYAGSIFLVVMLLASGAWFAHGLRTFSTLEDEKWARQMFFYSLKVLVIFCVVLSVSSITI